jgi:hypothetical protein
MMWLAIVLCAVASELAAAEEPQLGPNLVQNPGFEEVQDGRPVAWYLPSPVYTLDESVARTGRRSLKFDNRDAGVYVMCSQDLPLEPGAIYEAKAYVRTQGIQGGDSGATVCLEWQDAAGNYLGGFYLPGRKGDTPDWTEVSGVSVQLPPQAARAHILCYVRKGMTGTAWWDDVSVRRVHRSPMQAFLAEPRYRGWLLDGQPLRIEARVSLLPAELKGAPDQYALDGVFRAVGAPASMTTVKVPEAAPHSVLRLDLSDLRPGRYEFETRLVDKRTGEVVARDTELVERRTGPLPRCHVDEHNRLIVDGQPFFPLGMYWGGLDEAELRIYADGPFNCLMPYALPTREQLDVAQAHGLKVIYSIKDFYYGSQWCPGFIRSQADEEPAVRRYVRQFRDHPTLLAWYINDELPLSYLSQLVAHRRWVQEEDPDHPAWVVLFQVDDLASYVHSFDVIGTDPYPIPDRPAAMAADWARRTREAVADARPIWMVPQVFSKAVYDGPAEGRRPPTFEEMRSMAWQCIAEGANGLVFYSWFDLRRDSAHPFEEQWAKVKRVAEEVKRMSPALLSVEPVPALKVEASEGVHWTARVLSGTLYLFFVNAAASPAETSVRLAARPGGVATAEGQVVPLREDGSFALRLAPLGVVVCTVGPAGQ